MIIAYTGIGANGKVYFSVDDFLCIMRENFQHFDYSSVCDHIRELRLTFRDRILPQEFPLFSLDDWVDYSGALKLDVDADDILLEIMNENYNLINGDNNVIIH